MEHVEMDLLKREKIRNILENSAESLIQTVLEEKGLEYRLCFRDSGIELLVYRDAKYLTTVISAMRRSRMIFGTLSMAN